MNFLNYKRIDPLCLFDELDTEKLYRSNVKKLGKEWIYRNKDISYKFNSHGFRTQEFTDIDWQNSIVVIGDSIVYGTGLAEEDTICSNIERMSGISTVNLGISGSAIDIAMFNSITLYNNFPKPKALVHLWTSLVRYTDFKDNGLIINYLPKKKNFYNGLDWITRSKMYIDVERSVWKDTVPRYEGSFFEITQTQVDNVDRLTYIDHARDLIHPGIESVKLVAEKILKNLSF